MVRVAVLSSTNFGRRCVEEGIVGLQGVELAGVLTTPRQIRISYSEKPVDIKTHCDFGPVGKRIGCPVAVFEGPPRPRDYLDHLEQWRPDLLLALGWYYKVPQGVRSAAPGGCLGIHASLLPKYRGGAPIPWAIINGESRSGVTLFYLEDEMDAGDVVAQSAFSIEPHDTCATVYEKAEQASVEILRTALPQFAAGTAPRTPQDHSQATTFPQRSPKDGLIDWSWDATRIRNFIRAQTHPYPGAFFYSNGKKVTVWDASIVDDAA